MNQDPRVPRTSPPWAIGADQVRQRLAPIRARPDGTLLTQPSGPHFVVITKENSEIRLWLMEQNRPTTGVVQSEMDLDAPLHLIEGYTQAMTLALLWNPAPQRVFFSGLGGGRVPLVFHCLLPQVQIFAAEIDPQIIQVAAQHFGLEIGNRISVDLADGRQWLEQRVEVFDIIVVDVFLDNGYTPYRQATAEFYALCRARLDPEGVLVINLLENDPYTARKIATLRTIFSYVCYVPVDEENTIVFASDSDRIRPELARSRAEQLNQEWQLPYPFQDMAAHLSTDLSRFALAPEEVLPLYDDSPPKDYFRQLPSLSGPLTPAQMTWPCPCGSGRAYGICHGALTAPDTSRAAGAPT